MPTLPEKIPAHRGVIVPMVSPFDDSGRPDVPAVGRLVEKLLAAKVTGIFVLGTTGEGASISSADKSRIVRATVQAVKGRATVYAGISGNCLGESIDWAAEYAQLGVNAVVAHAPSYFPISGDQIEHYFEKLAGAVPLALVLYNIPITTHLSIPVESVERLSRHPNISGVKDSANDLPRFEQLIARVGGRDDFQILSGCSPLFAQSLKLGAHGLVPSTANFAPEPFVAMCAAAAQKDWASVDELHRKGLELSARFQAGRSLPDSIAMLKKILAAEGVCSPAVLPPLRPISSP